MSGSRLRALALGVLLAGLAAGALGGCGERPRSNVLDPENPETGGGPILFRALGSGDGVTLRWNPAPGRADLLGFRLERRRAGPDPFLPLGDVLALNSTGTFDPTAQWDLDYEYRLSFLTNDSTVSGAAVTAVARPGRETVWVSDPGLDQVVRVTPDGRERVLAIGGVRGVNRIAIDPIDGAVWATEPFDGRMHVFSALGVPLSTFPGLTGPNAIAVEPTTGIAWVCDEEGGDVARYDRGGTIQGSPQAFANPQDVAVTVSGTAGAWIVDPTLGTVTFVSSAGVRGTPIVVGGDPRRVAVHSVDGSLWVTRLAANEVVHYSTAGVVLSRTALNTPFGIDIDEARGLVWVGLDLENAVVGLAANGAELHRTPGISRPRGLVVADRTGEVWVAAIASGEIVRLSDEGAILTRNAGFDAPLDIRIDPNPRPMP